MVSNSIKLLKYENKLILKKLKQKTIKDAFQKSIFKVASFSFF
jgi:hypothetical protein